tara:strand:- start:4723 stop:6081 length:1359 start_codon:yes stop_codon:yes gene_type:complete
VEKPNILLIVVDSLRSDKFFGAKKSSLTPTIDKLIQDGTYFEQTISSAASTILAVSSLLTGIYPFKLGLGGTNYKKYPSESNNIAKILNEHGYTTYATAPEVATDFGLVCDFKNPDTAYDNYYSLFAGLGDEIIKKFRNNILQGPWFFYIHLFDLHTPVIVPSSFDEEKFGISKYERMVSAIDNWLSKLFEYVEKENTIIIITSDHGEYIPVVQTENGIISLESSNTDQKLWKFGNKIPKNLYPLKQKMGSVIRKSRDKIKSAKLDEIKLSEYEKRILSNTRMSIGHKLFDDFLKVPLLFVGPRIPEQKLVKNLTRQIDIFPTILEILELNLPKNIDGKSLKSLMNNQLEDEFIALIESPPSLKNTSPKFVGLRNSKYKYIKSLDDKKSIPELYDLTNDPLEEKNISSEQPDLAKNMEKSLSELRNYDIKGLDFDDGEKERVENTLKKLGYI